MQQPIQRTSLIWLLMAQAMIVLPHLLRTPWLLLPLWAFCLVCLWQFYQGRWHLPKTWLKTVFVVLSFAGVFAVERRIFSMDGMVLLLIMAFFLKLLELKQQRDLLIGIYLAYFVIATQMLFEQDIVSAVYLLASLVLVTTALVANHIASERLSLWYPMKVASQLLVVSLPIMLIAFMVFPRLPPLWAMPTPSDKGRTGMSDTMQPGNVAELAESDELVFRSEFYSETPPLSSLYWRGLVLEHYDGKTWREAKTTAMEDISAAYQEQNAVRYHYQITQEPQHKRWVFALDGVLHYEGRVRLLDDYTLQAYRPIYQREQWQLTSAPSALKIKELTPFQRRLNTFLPEQQNPRMQTLAQQWWQASDNTEHYIDKILQHFHQEDFYYTLTPAVLGENAVDEFLFTTRRGFCEHYAHAFVSLVRTVGIPARVIVGYQGGDINPYQQHVTVRQLDAHAWAEVWLEGQGWVRFDPTYAVAPERIERGSRESLSQEERYLAKSPLSAVKFASISWINQMQYRFDQMNYWWHSTVLSYQGEQQQSLLKRWFGQQFAWKIALLLMTGLALTAFVVLVLLYWRYRPKSLAAQQRLYHHFVKKLAKQGLSKPASMGAEQFAQLAEQRFPSQAQAIQTITALYLALQYADLNASEQKEQQQQLIVAVKQFRPV